MRSIRISRVNRVYVAGGMAQVPSRWRKRGTRMKWITAEADTHFEAVAALRKKIADEEREIKTRVAYPVVQRVDW